MTVLGIETSCDETSCAILINDNNRIQILSNIVSSSANLQSKYGGIIPEQAAREQVKFIIPAIAEALEQAKLTSKDIGAIAVTQGPGLIGSLLVGVETAKVLAKIWSKPLIPINHLIGHFYANWISTENLEFIIPSFPCLGLLVSGGHSDIVLFTDHNKYKYLGGTRDDAAGECFDKSARLIGYPYPGGPKISKIAQKGNPKAFNLPRPMAASKDFDFSFSGLKTAFANLVAENFKVNSINPEDANLHWKHIVLEETKLAEQEQLLADMCASIEQAIIDSLIKKTIKAAQINKVEQIIVAGGVAANPLLTKQLRENFSGKVFVPPSNLCTDNAAMIASAAFFQKPTKDPLYLQANPNLSLAY